MLRFDARALRERQSADEPAVNRVPCS